MIVAWDDNTVNISSCLSTQSVCTNNKVVHKLIKCLGGSDLSYPASNPEDGNHKIVLLVMMTIRVQLRTSAVNRNVISPLTLSCMSNVHVHYSDL